MQNFTLFSREKGWNLKCFHFFREMKSETNIPFTLFEKWKVKWFFVSLFSRSKSEIKIPRDRDWEVKFEKKSREFSRNDTLAGYWLEGWTLVKEALRPPPPSTPVGCHWNRRPSGCHSFTFTIFLIQTSIYETRIGIETYCLPIWPDTSFCRLTNWPLCWRDND